MRTFLTKHSEALCWASFALFLVFAGSMVYTAFTLELNTVRFAALVLSTVFSGILTCFFYTLLYWKRVQHMAPPKPRIHVWERNGITKVCADPDFELALQQRARQHMAYPGVGYHFHRPSPQLYALFSEDEKVRASIGGTHVHPMAKYYRLIEGCEVISSEMQVERTRAELLQHDALMLNAIWLLVHGQNVPPESEPEKTA